ncbi:MAG: hypothetical protein WB919_15945 [Candidatus Sulfotelmatobacter sp.]
MSLNTVKNITWANFVLVAVLSAAWPGQAQEAKTPYPSMAPIDRYLIADRNAEIALARTAAPAAISRDAEVLVLGQTDYEIAVKGKNGFVCAVERSWGAGFDDPEFWNFKNRSPICFNPPAARSVLPVYLNRTKMILAGRSKAQMIASIKAAFDKKELSTPEPGSMCYMMSKEAYLTDSGSHNLAHLMFEVPRMDGAALGADVPNSPVIVGEQHGPEPITEMIVPVGKWSDGTAAPTD